MEVSELKQKVADLMEGRKAHEQSRIVEIETKEHTRRGLLRGIQTDGVLVFSWIPELAKDVKSIELLSMDIVTVQCEYEAEEVLSIKN